MGDNAKNIESRASSRCYALRFIRLSKTLQVIGLCALSSCDPLDAFFLPSTITWIGESARSLSLKLLVLPNQINLCRVKNRIITGRAVYHSARTAGVKYVGVMIMRVITNIVVDSS